ncbi:hypothetical protein BJY04DRAFT_179039, partial [Aspergillus karnatakaensis]|uniref:telomerase inhibitor/ribosome biogenesis protein PXR1 n=1 Tax=Aspergillus karnatakaensis TaxID=1810916 RepID=UPI003CCDC5DB
MGLAAPRKKIKISHDPNNTNWSRSTSGFGHKILSSQGWTPGSFLGARNAAHAEMFTSASASHIRVIVKDDTLGLGARSKRDLLDEPTGLDAFKGLLGRLNGKSDTELQADQKKREDVKLARYAATKWNAVRFISGGLLAQEKDDSSVSTTQKLSTDDKNSTLPASERALRETTFSADEDGTEGRSTALLSREQREKNGKGKDKKSKKDKKEKKEKKEMKEKEKKDKKKRKYTEQEEGSGSSSQEQSSEYGAKHIGKKQPPSDALSSRERRPLGRHMIRG